MLSAASAQNNRNTARAAFRMPSGLTETDYLANTIVFKMKPEFRNECSRTSVNIAQLQLVFSRLGTTTTEKIFPNKTAPAQERNAAGQKLVDLSLIYKLQFTSNVNLEKAINNIISTGQVEYAEPFYVPHLLYNPNDPNTGLQYALTKINAYLAWNVTMGDTNVVVGIVDTGTDWDHPDLEPNLKYNYADPINGIDDEGDGYVDNYRGYDMADNDNNPMVDGGGGQQAHGSHVSGCASAATDNGTGVASPGFNCKFLPVKASMASDPNTYLVAGYQGIVYAADHGCSVINCSWGSAGGGSFGQDAVTYATNNEDALVVCAAGNDGNETVFFPASYQYVLSVASTQSNDGKSGFSNYGINIDVCAPGSNIYATYYNNGYGYSSGTSMASPVCAGAAALVRSQFPAYNALQAGEQLRMTCDNIYGVAGNGVYQDKLGRGRINLYNAVVQNPPSIRFENKFSTDNNDDSFVIGDTINISGDFKNYLAATTNLNVTLSSTSPYVTILNNSYMIGALGTLATVNNASSPFAIKINAGTPLNTTVTLKLTFVDGSYNDFQVIEETVNVDYINITINDVSTTQTSKGQLFWNSTGQAEGLGFNYLGNQMVYDGGPMIGNNNQVSDMMRAAAGTFDTDFQSSLRITRTLPSVVSEFDLYGKFSDNGAAPSLKIRTTHKTYAWSTPGNRKYIIVEYSIKDTGATSLTSLYAGIFADWDVMDYTLNKAGEDAARKMGYVWSTQANGLYAGIKLLTTGPWKHYALDNVTGGGGGIDMYTDYTSAEKYTTLSTNRPAAGGAGTGNDVCDVVSSGPFSLAPGDSVVVAFAIIAGDDLADLQENADSAQVHYNNITTGIDQYAVTSSEFTVYPNPAQNELVVRSSEFGDKCSFKIYDVSGREVLNSEIRNPKSEIKINVSNLQNGIYFYELNADGKTYNDKFTVVK